MRVREQVKRDKERQKERRVFLRFPSLLTQGFFSSVIFMDVILPLHSVPHHDDNAGTACLISLGHFYFGFWATLVLLRPYSLGSIRQAPSPLHYHSSSLTGLFEDKELETLILSASQMWV